MQVLIDRDQCKMLLELIESRIRELHPEIRHTRLHAYHDQLKNELASLQLLSERLQDCLCDVSA